MNFKKEHCVTLCNIAQKLLTWKHYFLFVFFKKILSLIDIQASLRKDRGYSFICKPKGNLE